jgi:sec-independent protein translocase protein TatA
MVGLDNPLHLVFLLVIVLLIFGAKRLPDIGRSLGSGLRSFKESVSGESGTLSDGEQPAGPTRQLTESVEFPGGANKSTLAQAAEELKARNVA